MDEKTGSERLRSELKVVLPVSGRAGVPAWGAWRGLGRDGRVRKAQNGEQCCGVTLGKPPTLSSTGLLSCRIGRACFRSDKLDIEGQTVNILGFAGHTVSTILITTQLC